MDNSAHICLIAPPLKRETGWVRVPPLGYGGIQWGMVHLMDGLLDRGHRVTLLGAPGSEPDPRIDVPDVAEDDDIVAWLNDVRPDAIHDFANFSTFHESVPPGSAFCRTWQMTGAPPGDGNTIYVSEAQLRAAGVDEGVVIPLPINVARYSLAERKGDYLLFLGRISEWKGAYEAAALARFLDVPLKMAGPVWEPEYFDRIMADFPEAEWCGEVGGEQRARLLSEARALAVLSQPVPGPWGQMWCEPGATVVAEAAASGTPILASDNGCLPSLMPGVGVVVGSGTNFTDASVLDKLPSPSAVRQAAATRWDYRALADENVLVYERCERGDRWK